MFVSFSSPCANLYGFTARFVGSVIPSEILKIMLQMILQGLDYLHTECQVIYTGMIIAKLTVDFLNPSRVAQLIVGTDLKPDNIMVKIEDISILDRDARNEFEHPLPRKQCEDGRTIYLSRNNYGQPSATTGIVRITDFGLSVRGHLPHRGCIQAEVYRAPEVIIDAGYTYSADIWSLGVMV